MDEKLKALINNFNKKFEEAQDARSEVLDYLEEKYNIDTREESDTIEENCLWCYGLDINAIERLIKKINTCPTGCFSTPGGGAVL